MNGHDTILKLFGWIYQCMYVSDAIVFMFYFLSIMILHVLYYLQIKFRMFDSFTWFVQFDPTYLIPLNSYIVRSVSTYHHWTLISQCFVTSLVLFGT